MSLLTAVEIAAEFPLTREYLYFNGASTGIIPERALAAAENFLTLYRDSDLSHDAETFRKLDDLRENMAKLIGAESGSIALVPNTSVGLNIIASGLKWSEGDEIIVGNREFPANSYPWANLRDKGVRLRWIEMEDGRITPGQIAENINDDTRLLTISAVQFGDGYRADLNSIGKICEDNGVILTVDGIQAAGALSANCAGWGVSAFAAGGQKHLLSGYGTGFLMVSKKLLDRLSPAYDGWLSHFTRPEDFLDMLRHNMPPAIGARRLEVGSLAYPNLLAMHESMKMLLELRISEVERHNLNLSDIFCDGISRIPGASVTSDRSPENKSHIVSVEVDDAETAAAGLRENKVICSLREGRLRFAFHIYNSEDQVERALSVLGKSVR